MSGLYDHLDDTGSGEIPVLRIAEPKPEPPSRTLRMSGLSLATLAAAIVVSVVAGMVELYARTNTGAVGLDVLVLLIDLACAGWVVFVLALLRDSGGRGSDRLQRRVERALVNQEHSMVRVTDLYRRQDHINARLDAINRRLDRLLALLDEAQEAEAEVERARDALNGDMPQINGRDVPHLRSIRRMN